jgi:hypothetical protein
MKRRREAIVVSVGLPHVLSLNVLTLLHVSSVVGCANFYVNSLKLPLALVTELDASSMRRSIEILALFHWERIKTLVQHRYSCLTTAPSLKLLHCVIIKYKVVTTTYYVILAYNFNNAPGSSFG